MRQYNDFKYKSAVWLGEKQIKVIEKPIPAPGPGEILLKVKAAGICGTDLHILSGKHPQARPPLVPGHEFAGLVVNVGEGVDKNLIGSRVGSDSYVGCGECIYCLTKRTQLCIKGTTELGINIDGGWSEYVVVPAGNIYMLPENVDFFIAGAGCILNCPIAAIEKVRVNHGDFVFIIGDGPSSLVMIQLARLKGASTVIVAGHRQKRLSLCIALGADKVINTNFENLEAAINVLPQKPNVIIDAVGKSESFASALLIASIDCRIHLFGLPEDNFSNIPMDIFLWKRAQFDFIDGAAISVASNDGFSITRIYKDCPDYQSQVPIEKAPEALDFIRKNPKK